MIVETIHNGKILHQEIYIPQSQIEVEAKKMIKRYIIRKARKVKRIMKDFLAATFLIVAFLMVIFLADLLSSF